MARTAADLRPHQRYALEWLHARPRAILAMEQRLGKTPVALLDLVPPANILVPAFLRLQWLDECRTWRPDLAPVIVHPGERARDLGGNVWITSYESLQESYLFAAPTLIVDEGHYCKSHEAKRTVTTLALAERATRVRWLSGTVMPNRSMELWPVMTAMRATAMSATDFGVRYAGGYQDQWGGWQFRANTHSDELQAKLDPYILRMTREQVGLPSNEWKVVALDLPVDARERAYDLAAIARNPTPVAFEGLADLLHFQARSKLPWCLQYLLDLLRSGEGPLLVFAWHQDIIAELARALTARGFRVAAITGAVSEAERRERVKEFQSGQCDVLIGNTKAAGVGLPLHMAERVVFVEGRWTPADMTQAADRGVSMERPRSLRVDVLVVNASIDEFMVRRCLEKQGAIDRIIQPNQEFAKWHENPLNRLPPETRAPSRWWRMPCA